MNVNHCWSCKYIWYSINTKISLTTKNCYRINLFLILEDIKALTVIIWEIFVVKHQS